MSLVEKLVSSRKAFERTSSHCLQRKQFYL